MGLYNPSNSILLNHGLLVFISNLVSRPEAVLPSWHLDNIQPTVT